MRKELQDLEILLDDIFLFEKEYKFHSKRKWRFDYAIPIIMLAIEVEGSTWAQGRHTRGRGYAADCEKYNQAQILGWTVLRYTYDMLRDIEQVENDIQNFLDG